MLIVNTVCYIHMQQQPGHTVTVHVTTVHAEIQQRLQVGSKTHLFLQVVFDHRCHTEGSTSARGGPGHCLGGQPLATLA